MEGSAVVGPANIGEKLSVSSHVFIGSFFQFLELANYQHSTGNSYF